MTTLLAIALIAVLGGGVHAEKCSPDSKGYVGSSQDMLSTRS